MSEFETNGCDYKFHIQLLEKSLSCAALVN